MKSLTAVDHGWSRTRAAEKGSSSQKLSEGNRERTAVAAGGGRKRERKR